MKLNGVELKEVRHNEPNDPLRILQEPGLAFESLQGGDIAKIDSRDGQQPQQNILQGNMMGTVMMSPARSILMILEQTTWDTSLENN